MKSDVYQCNTMVHCIEWWDFESQFISKVLAIVLYLNKYKSDIEYQYSRNRNKEDKNGSLLSMMKRYGFVLTSSYTPSYIWY